MDGPLKELAKLDKIVAGGSAGKAKAPSIDQSLDALLDTLREAKERYLVGTGSQAALITLSKTVEAKKKEIDERQREVYNALAKVGKALDKRFTNPLPSYDPLFSSPEAKEALERTIAVHFLRTGEFETAETFLSESDATVPDQMRSQFMELHKIMMTLRDGDISFALDWAHRHGEFLHNRPSSLEFHLYRFQYLRLLMSPTPDVPSALAYARANFPKFYARHSPELRRLMTCVAYLPLNRIRISPYADLADPSIHADLERMFATEYCANLGMSRQAPLRVISDIGGCGALARIEKGRKVMRERKSEWSQSNELPIEIPLGPEHTYHSVFACPVSKEQSTEDNPPMMLFCGHAVTKESLSKLSRQQRSIDFIEEVISRAPATASTFLTIFKAYNDVLHERGLDPQNEVVYYGKLLKIGTLKGKSWAGKWSIVKDLQGYGTKASASTKGGRTTRVARTKPTPAKPTSKPPVRPPVLPPEPDTFTLHSHQDDATQAGTGLAPVATHVSSRPCRSSHDDTPRPTRLRISPVVSSANSLGLDTGPPSTLVNTGDALRRLAARARTAATRRWDADTATETATQASSIPPSYGAAVRDDPPRIPYEDKGKAPAHPRKPFSVQERDVSPPLPAVSKPPAKEALSRQTRGRSNSQDDDAPSDPFKKITYTQNLELAAQFRNDRLVERCYEVWKQGFEWILTTAEQITEARDSLVLRRALQHWRKRTAVRRETYLRVSALSNRRFLKRALQAWKVKTKEKKQLHWRDDMRMRMKTVRERGELRLKKDMWARQLSRRVVQRFFGRWKSKLRQLDQLEAAADHFVGVREETALVRVWETWRRSSELRHAEKALTERINFRLKTSTMDIWRRNSHAYHVAEQYHDALLVKHAMSRWKASRIRVRAMEHRAMKHSARRDDVLIRAIMRIWKAHERGHLLTRVRTLRMIKQAWQVWKRRVEELKEREEMAELFRMRACSILEAQALKKWRTVHRSHQNAQTFAVHYHRVQLQFKMLLQWRLQLRSKLKVIKQAKTARKYLLLRRCFHVWSAKVEEQRRERKLQQFQLRATRKHFIQWLERARQQRNIRLAELVMTHQVAMRIMDDALQHWTTRVADLKFRELETINRYNKALVLRSYDKWKALCRRHVDELSLMESYQDVKREENMRKMFYRWFAAAKKARHRRLQLQAKEEEVRLMLATNVWDKWRERFLDIRLQPLADAFLKQRQRDLVLRAYGTWHSRSLSFPAVRFHTSHLKAKFWKRWRELMPRAMQSKTAREMDCLNTLKKVFALWRKAQQKKLDHKAIKLPQVPRVSALNTRPRTVLPTVSRLSRMRTPVPNDEGPVEDGEPPPRNIHRTTLAPHPSRIDLTSMLVRNPRTASPERPKYVLSSRRSTRAPSPNPTETEPDPPGLGGIVAWRREVRPGTVPPKSAPPSVVGEQVPGTTRGSLWQELKEVRRRSRSRAPTERDRSPEPL
ncbi:uncharacterized protein BXZ73DRAFT_86381 [Epithele typhae]|uniref:uncharacterized protein n=1 Tax=Epithele typhae TaxID=378194 RepID=UPI0020083F7B|nr:uncharacterized protein BXZ73DRAFT_86381 [Epithele typhae]KAH9946207.1 hypothetical protein BXZ73DRAFT_86381 [Epithele typhae]